jgi:hypothetical protein
MPHQALASVGRGAHLDDHDLLTEALSLRFNQEEFCDELYLHRKTPRFLSSQAQAAVLIAG